jgi:hypothetical protein
VLKDSILKFLKLDSLIENLTGYVEARIELLKIEIKEEIAKVVTHAGLYLLLVFAGTLFIFFTSMALAFKLSEYLGNFGGFGVVATLYFLVALSLWIFRDKISQKLERELKEIMKQKKK